MRYKLLSIIVFSCLFFAFPLHAQEHDIADMSPEDYIKLKLPPLDSLFENAKKGATFKILDIKKQNEISLLKKEKRSWLNYFNVGAGYNYGILGNTSGFSDSATPLYYQYNESTQHSYHIGGGIGFSIEDLFDLRPRIKRQRLKVDEIDLQKEKNEEELKQQIITLYSSIISSMSILKIKGESLALINARYQIEESDFLNGKIDINAITTIKSMKIQAYSDYEATRSVVNRDIMILEVITHTPIFNKK